MGALGQLVPSKSQDAPMLPLGGNKNTMTPSAVMQEMDVYSGNDPTLDYDQEQSYYYPEEQEGYYYYDNYDVEEEEDEIPMYETTEEANKAFVECIRSEMNRIYGDSVTHYVDQLYFHMYPTAALINVKDAQTLQVSQIMQQFWNMPLQHPLAVLLQDHYDDTGQHKWKAKYTCPYGDMIVYDQDAMNDCLRSVEQMCRENGYILQTRDNPYALPQLIEDDNDDSIIAINENNQCHSPVIMNGMTKSPSINAGYRSSTPSSFQNGVSKHNSIELDKQPGSSIVIMSDDPPDVDMTKMHTITRPSSGVDIERGNQSAPPKKMDNSKKGK